MVDRDFLDGHIKHLEETLLVLYSKDMDSDLNRHERAGTATFIMNIYTGVENILRHILEETKNTKLARTATWHKDLLNKCVECGVISDDLKDTLSQYMRFRHRHVHGYGYMDDWDFVKPLALNAGNTVEKLFSELKKNGCL